MTKACAHTDVVGMIRETMFLQHLRNYKREGVMRSSSMQTNTVLNYINLCTLTKKRKPMFTGTYPKMGRRNMMVHTTEKIRVSHSNVSTLLAIRCAWSKPQHGHSHKTWEYENTHGRAHTHTRTHSHTHTYTHTHTDRVTQMNELYSIYNLKLHIVILIYYYQ